MFLNPIGTTVTKLMAKVQGKGNGRSSRLVSFSEHTAGQRITAQEFLGKQDVLLTQIKGSMNNGRCHDFNANFQLVNAHGRERLENVAKAWRTKSLSPISLVQVGDIYFVQDGHHRVSIAATQGQSYISATVTILQLAPTTSPSLNNAFSKSPA